MYMYKYTLLQTLSYSWCTARIFLLVKYGGVENPLQSDYEVIYTYTYTLPQLHTLILYHNSFTFGALPEFVLMEYEAVKIEKAFSPYEIIYT